MIIFIVTKQKASAVKTSKLNSDIKTRKDETEYIKHRLVLKYDNGCISAEVIDMIIKDFYPNYINKIR